MKVVMSDIVDRAPVEIWYGCEGFEKVEGLLRVGEADG